MKTILKLLVIFFFSISLQAQESEPEMRWSKVGRYENKIEFEVTGIPELVPIPGAKEDPEVKYLWLFGDGGFSFDDNPMHIYDVAHYAPFDAEFYLTYTYTDTGKDGRKNKKQHVALSTGGNNTGGVSPTDEFPMADKDNAIFAQTNQQASAGDSFVAIISYKNTGSQPMDGRIDVNYNQESTCKTCFSVEEEPRLYNGETRREIGLTSLLNTTVASLHPMAVLNTSQDLDHGYEKQDGYLNNEIFDFTGLGVGESKNIFLVMKTNSAMTDTSLTTNILLTIRDAAGRPIGNYPLEIELVSSHDPNSILASNHRGRMNRKFTLPWRRKSPIKFKINFQNKGDGPASKVRIVSDISQKLDYTTLKVHEARIGKEKIRIDKDSVFFYQAYPDSLVFNFKDIYLAGTGQSDAKKKESKGYVIYSIKTGKKRPKLIKSRANIYFDSNENVITKRSKVKLKNATRYTLEIGAILPPVTSKFIPVDLALSLDNKYIGIGTSALMPKRFISLDVKIKYSRTVYRPSNDELLEEFIRKFDHLTFGFSPQIDILPFLRLGVDVEAGVLLSGKEGENREFFLFGQESDLYSPLRYGGAVNLLLGRTKRSGFAVGASYYLMNDKLPINDVFNESGRQWHNGLTFFIRYKL